MADVTPAQLSPVDVEFLLSMVEHHQAAIEMATEYLAQPASQRLNVVSQLAQTIVTAQTREIQRMIDWLGILASQVGQGDDATPMSG